MELKLGVGGSLRSQEGNLISRALSSLRKLEYWVRETFEPNYLDVELVQPFGPRAGRSLKVRFHLRDIDVLKSSSIEKTFEVRIVKIGKLRVNQGALCERRLINGQVAYILWCARNTKRFDIHSIKRVYTRPTSRS